MKTYLKRISFVILISIFSNIQAQTETTLATFNFDAWVEEAPNGAWIAAGENFNSPDAFVEVQMPNGTVYIKDFLHTNQPGADSQNTQLNTNIYNGMTASFNSYFFVRGKTCKNSGDDAVWFTLRKYDYTSNPNPLVEKTVKEAGFEVFNVFDDAIIVLRKLSNYDQMSTDWNISGPAGHYYIFKIDEYGNKGSNPVIQLPSEPYIIYKDVLQELPNGNIGVNLHNGNLIEVDINGGSIVRTIITGMEDTNKNVVNDDWTFIQGGLDEDYDIVTKLYDANGTFLYKTDLPNPNHNNFGFRWDTALKIGGVYYMTRGARYFTLGEKLTHGEIHVLLSQADYTKTSYPNSDGTYTFIARIGNEGQGAITKVYHVIPPAETEPLLSEESDNNVVSVIDGQVYNHSTNSWEDSFYESTMVVNTLPAVGSSPNTNWINTPSGYTVQGYLPVEEITRNGEVQRVCRARFTKNGTNDRIQLKIRFELASEVTGVEDLSIKEFGLYPNPINDVLNIRSEEHEIASVKIVNVLGQEVLNNEFTGFSNVYNVNVSSLKHGHYLVVITTTDGRMAVGKLVK
jgi:hypothetical protein